MLDAFITTTKEHSKEREYSLALTQLALHLQGFNVKIVEKQMLERYFECDRISESEIYIVCDDDIIPSSVDSLYNLVNTLKRYPDFSQMGLGWRPDMKSESESTWIRFKYGDVWEMDHVGGCVAVRKGTIKDLGYRTDYKNGIGDDKVVGKIARELGYKVGIVPSLWFYHLGTTSVVWK